MARIKKPAGMFANIRFRIFEPGKRSARSLLVRARANQMFTADGVDNVTGHVASMVEKAHPGEQFRLVAIGGNVFNIIHIPKEAPACCESQAENSPA